MAVPKIPCRISQKSFTWALLIALAAGVGGCSKPVPKVEEVRPVRAIQLGAQRADVSAEFSGDVRARVES
ncbi:MAG: efflux transporter periplasmic adaptor subunit, partial [Oxalobacteraceae bacterium]